MILELKRDEHGRPARFNARLVARGYLLENIEVLVDLYALEFCIKPVRTSLSVAQTRGWSILQKYFKGALLDAFQSKLEGIWLELPNIRCTKIFGQMVKLFKYQYRLEQAQKIW